MHAPLRLALGCMRLSQESAAVVVRAALDAGVRIFDTADVYATSDDAIGENERLVARALASARSNVEIVTKGGLTRPGGRWRADGRARHLRAACEASVEALGGAPIDLYLLHAPDPRTPLSTSVRALDALRREGLVKCIGLSNVNATELEEARSIASIDAVEVELSPFADDPLRNGVARACADAGIRLFAHTPLGGPKRRRAVEAQPALRATAAHVGATPFEVLLAWLADLDPCIVPVVGATRPETITSAARAAFAIALDAHARAILDEAFPAGRAFRERALESSARPGTSGLEVVVVMGIPGAGKSTRARALVEEGHARLERDAEGGKLDGLLPKLDALLAAGRSVVLDNTYPTRASRDRVIEVARRHGASARCEWMTTPIEDAQINAVERILAGHGRLLGPDEMKHVGKRDASVIPPRALFDYERRLEAPTVDEGFARVDHIAFERATRTDRTGRALFVELEGVVRESRSGRTAPVSLDDLVVRTERAARLARAAADGAMLFGLSWQPDRDGGTLDEPTADACFERTWELLGVRLEPLVCAHAAGPPRCWCRRPLPGLVVAAAHAHGIDLGRSVLVGKSSADRTLARRTGMAYLEADAFFAPDQGGATPR